MVIYLNQQQRNEVKRNDRSRGKTAHSVGRLKVLASCWAVGSEWRNFSRRLRKPFNDSEVKKLKTIIKQLSAQKEKPSEWYQHPNGEAGFNSCIWKHTRFRSYYTTQWSGKARPMRGELEFILKNIDITRPVPRMRTIPQVKKEFPDLQLSERYLRSLVREHKVVCVQVGVKTS